MGRPPRPVSERLALILGRAIDLSNWPQTDSECFQTPSPAIHASGQPRKIVRALLEEIADEPLHRTWRVIPIPSSCTMPFCRNPHHYCLDEIRRKDGTSPVPLPPMFAKVRHRIAQQIEATQTDPEVAATQNVVDAIREIWPEPTDRPTDPVVINERLTRAFFDEPLERIEAALAQIKRENDPCLA